MGCLIITEWLYIALKLLHVSICFDRFHKYCRYPSPPSHAFLAVPMHRFIPVDFMVGRRVLQRWLLQAAETQASRLQRPVPICQPSVDVSERVTQTFTDSDPARIFPHDTASSGRAPESEPSNS